MVHNTFLIQVMKILIKNYMNWLPSYMQQLLLNVWQAICQEVSCKLCHTIQYW